MPSSVYPNRPAAAITSPVMNAAPHDSRRKVSPMQVSQTAMSEAEGAFRLGLNSGALLTCHQKMRSVVLGATPAEPPFTPDAWSLTRAASS
jgi:hypothetical protein